MTLWRLDLPGCYASSEGTMTVKKRVTLGQIKGEFEEALRDSGIEAEKKVLNEIDLIRRRTTDVVRAVRDAVCPGEPFQVEAVPDGDGKVLIRISASARLIAEIKAAGVEVQDA